MSRPAPGESLTARRVFAEFLRVPKPGTRELVPLALYPEQVRFLDAFDARAADGRLVYDELAALWVKKAGKSTMGGGLVLAELVGNTTEPDREVIIVASDFSQSKEVTFASAARFVKRHPWLAKHIRVLASELVYRETVTDARTGGRHVEEHIARAVPSRDARSLHGTNATLTVFDEYWTQADYAAVEALARSATRRAPRILYLSYVGLRSQQREGVPIWDLWQRWKGGSDPGLFVSYLGGPDGWRQVPWMTQKFIDAQRRQFAAVPSKFRRLFLNEWSAGDEGAFLTAEEIHDAIDPTLREPDQGDGATSYTLGVDLGITNDWTAVCVTHIDAGTSRLVIDAVRTWRGTRATPVALSAVEDTLAALARRFPLSRVVLDHWQAAMLSERLRAWLTCPVETVVCDPSRLDRHATMLKGLFSGRQIRVPPDPTLVEQLETIVGEETKRRDKVRFTSGTGVGAGRHDDLVVALCLSAEGHGTRLGRATLPAQSVCYREASLGHPVPCYLWTPAGYLPSGCASCAACPSHRHVLEAWRTRGTGVDLRTFRQVHMPGDNTLTSRKKWAALDRAIATWL